RRRHTRFSRDWSSDVCSSDLKRATLAEMRAFARDLRRESYDLILETQGLLKTGLVMRLARLAPEGKRYGLANGTEGSGYEGASRSEERRVGNEGRCR